MGRTVWREKKMKKLMWILSFVPCVITAIVLQFMPDMIPVHYDFSGKIDRWGSRYEKMIFPIVILIITLFWQILISYFERKAEKTDVDKDRAEALSNVKFLSVLAIIMALIYVIINCVSLYSSYIEASIKATKASVDIGKLSNILWGILLIVIGNFIPKTRKNSLIGVRISWSMYNDTTWMKSNRFCAIAFIVAGGLCVVTSAFTNYLISSILLLVYILGATVLTLIYAHKVYNEEKIK